MRLNVGSGAYRLVGDGWINIDADAAVDPDRVLTLPPLPYADQVVDEIWACHFLEHLTPTDADAFLAECFRCLKPGGRLGLVVPDTREIMRRWLAGAIDAVEYGPKVYWPIADLNTVCALFLYSTAQDSPHRWSYDAGTLLALMERHGFGAFSPIDRYGDPRLGTGQWYQVGWDAQKPGGAA